jgi:lysine 2,3-aminomutase
MKKILSEIKKKSANWKNWKWQQKNIITNSDELNNYFTKINTKFFNNLFNDSKRLIFQITPYMLSQIPKNITKKDILKNIWFQQFFPLGKIYTKGYDSYDGIENWEDISEFPTSNIHHKYTNRALIRFRSCFSKCNFCFEALGSLEKNPSKNKLFDWNDWDKTLEYLNKNKDVEEVILSGGEPLLYSDEILEKIFKDIKNIKNKTGKSKIRFLRIHTRVLTHNPFRITKKLALIFKKYKVNTIIFSVTHSSEITPEFITTVKNLRKWMGSDAPIFVSHTTLIKGINDNKDKLWELFSKLYELNIKPYYLLHTMPHIPYGNKQRIPVKKGVKILKALKRYKSNIAIPEYIIPHINGKITVPLEINGTPEFIYSKDKNGNPIIKFKNWKNQWVVYFDAKEKY